MKVYVDGQAPIALSKADFVASGGQGQVFAKAGVAFKVFTGSEALPEAKLLELSGLPSPPFAKPQAILRDAKGRVVGYTSRFVDDAYVLCQLFPRSFRDRVGLDHARTFGLVEQMKAGFRAAHGLGILLVDPNEMNFLVDARFESLTFIDTDAYRTPGHPAVAIMDSIRDRHMSDPHAFDEGTDWFSFACVSFQLLVGVHPYKGKHPSLSGLDARMRANVSVFSSEVRVPKSAYPFDVIPDRWRAWYEAVFERQERAPPPDAAAKVAVPALPARPVAPGPALSFEEVGSFEGTITGVWAAEGRLAVATDRGLWLDGRRRTGRADVAAVGFVPGSGRAVLACAGAGQVDLVDDEGAPVAFHLRATRAAGHEGRIHVAAGAEVRELILRVMGGRIVVTTRLAARVLANATTLFAGGVHQDVLGAAFVHLFTGPGRAVQVRLPELDGRRVLDARFCGGVLGVLARQGDRTDRILFRVDDRGARHDARVTEDVGESGLELAVTDRGAAVCLTGDDTLEVAPAALGASARREVVDDALGGDMHLFARGSEILVARGGVLWRMRLRP